MKTAKYFIAFAFVAAVLCSCSSGSEDTSPDTSEPSLPQGKLPITISTSVNALEDTRVTDYAFEQGDKVGIYVVNRNADGSSNPLMPQGNYVDNVLFAYDGTWSAASPVYWLDNETRADFYLYYPYMVSVPDAGAMAFNLNADQSSEEAYKASDVIVGTALDVAPTESAVAITARHVMSQIFITLVPGNGFTEESLAASDVSVKVNGVRTGALVDIANGSVTATEETSSVATWHVDGAYKAVIVPQDVAEGNLITVNIDRNVLNFKKAFTFVGGKRHQFTITLNKTGSGINVTIDQWDDDGTDNGGVAE